MKRIIIATGLLAAWFSWATAGTPRHGQAARPRSSAASAQALPDSSTPGLQGNYKGLDVDYCRALAAGILGDANKVALCRAPQAQNRFTELQSGRDRRCSIAIRRRPICAA